MDFKAWWASMAALGPAAMLLVTAADTALLPTAQAVDLLIVVQAAAHPEDWLALGVFAVVGSTLGAMALWAAARTGGGWALNRSISEERIARIRAQVRRYDALALALPTALPLPLMPMKLFIAAAGALGVGPLRTAVVVALARAVRYFGLIGLGVWYGEEAWELVRDNSGTIAAATGLAVVGYLAWLRYFRDRT